MATVTVAAAVYDASLGDSHQHICFGNCCPAKDSTGWQCLVANRTLPVRLVVLCPAAYLQQLTLAQARVADEQYVDVTTDGNLHSNQPVGKPDR